MMTDNKFKLFSKLPEFKLWRHLFGYIIPRKFFTLFGQIFLGKKYSMSSTNALDPLETKEKSPNEAKKHPCIKI